jgi:hypothetical protein
MSVSISRYSPLIWYWLIFSKDPIYMSSLRQLSAADLEGFQPISVRRESLLCCANLTFPPFACVPFAPIVWERLFVLSGWISADVNEGHMLWINKIRRAWEFMHGAQST